MSLSTITGLDFKYRQIHLYPYGIGDYKASVKTLAKEARHQSGYPHSPIVPIKSVQSLGANKEPIRSDPYDSYRY